MLNKQRINFDRLVVREPRQDATTWVQDAVNRKYENKSSLMLSVPLGYHQAALNVWLWGSWLLTPTFRELRPISSHSAGITEVAAALFCAQKALFRFFSPAYGVFADGWASNNKPAQRAKLEVGLGDRSSSRCMQLFVPDSHRTAANRGR